MENKSMQPLRLPRNQIAWERHLNSAGELVEVIASDADKKKWFLYEVEKNGSLVLVATGHSPAKLREKK